MPAAPSSDLIGTLIPVIVGGGIALTGAWLGPWLLEKRKEAAERKRTRAQKFEEMVAAVYEFDHWVDNLRQERAYGMDRPSTVSPFAKIEAISALYFPQFDPSVKALKKAADDYRTWMTKAGVARLSRQEEVIKGSLDLLDIPEMSVEPSGKAYDPYGKAKDALLGQLIELARKEFATRAPAHTA